MVKKSAASVNSVILIKILIYAGILCFVFGLAGYAYMGSFIRLIGDDYCYAGVMNQYGFWGGQVESYFHSVPYHGDRYFLTLISFIFSLLPAKINGWIPLLTLVIFSVGNVFLIGSLLESCWGLQRLISRCFLHLRFIRVYIFVRPCCRLLRQLLGRCFWWAGSSEWINLRCST